MAANYQQLRTQYPEFHYQSFAYHLNDAHILTASFAYQLGEKYTFIHQVYFHDVDSQLFKRQSQELLDNLVFHLGLIEAFSYWKLTASPSFIIDCGQLNDDQIDFWHQLLINGMGEYFYVNQIDFTIPNFVTFVTHGPQFNLGSAVKNHRDRLSCVNIGGGKDSAVMLAMLAAHHEHYCQLIIDPSSPAAHSMAADTTQKTFHIKRQFDPQLFVLNRQNFLNGHVPFSASVAFINLLAATVYDYDYALVGNESSSNEPSLQWLEHTINHQFSKSTKFEQSFQKYCSQYLIDNVYYFSFLRVFNELQIVHIFCSNPHFFSLTKSCNHAQQQNSWCHQCAKCLFVYLLLAAFLDEHILTTQIFTRNLLNDENLANLLAQLLGLAPTKPLECVGTIAESRAAFYLAHAHYQNQQQPLPKLLAQFASQILPATNWPQSVHELSTFFDTNHSLPQWALDIVSSYRSSLVDFK